MLDETLLILGYRPKDDSWDADGRRTYIHDEDATRVFLITLRGILARQGWHRDQHELRCFRHEATGHMIEIEAGGADCTGHYLHHMRAAIIDCKNWAGQCIRPEKCEICR